MNNRPVNYWTGGRWLDGKKLAAWIEPMSPPSSGRYTDDSPWPESLQRRIREWRLGAVADLYMIEHYIVALGLHASEIPDDCWVPGSPPRVKYCRRGHLIGFKNAYRNPKGYFECRACRIANRQRAKGRLKKAA